MKHSTFRNLSLAALGLILLAGGASPASANHLTITAVATGSPTPPLVPNTQGIQNGDFFIQPNTGAPITGDGIDEPTQWTFDFTADPQYPAFPANVPLGSALLTLSLTIGNTGITTDLVGITNPAYTSFILPGPAITPILQTLSWPGTYTVQIELLNFYTSSDILNALAANGGKIPMLYHDDVILFFARLDLVPGPGPLDHFKCYAARSPVPFHPITVRLRDQFETQEVTVVRPVMLCNPVEKCEESGVCTSPENPEAHLTCYQTDDAAGTPNFAQRNVLVTNQFGESQRLIVYRRQNLLCLPSLKTFPIPGTAP
jgi:hypothetical protein